MDCQDDRLPYPAGSGSAFDEFRTKALPFTRMDMTSAAAVSTLSGFSQVCLWPSHKSPVTASAMQALSHPTTQSRLLSF